MPVPDEIKIAPDFTVCEYCGKSYADTAENMHRVLIEKDGERRIFEACVYCIAKAKTDTAYDKYMTNKTFNEKLGRRLKFLAEEKQPEKTHLNCKHYHGDVVTAFENKEYENPCLTCFKYDKWESAE